MSKILTKTNTYNVTPRRATTAGGNKKSQIKTNTYKNVTGVTGAFLKSGHEESLSLYAGRCRHSPSRRCRSHAAPRAWVQTPACRFRSGEPGARRPARENQTQQESTTAP